MKILFFGSRGWIGKQFCEHLNKNNVEYMETSVRADNEKDVEKEIQEHNPTHIISFIGRTHGENYNTIDYLEQPVNWLKISAITYMLLLSYLYCVKNTIFIIHTWEQGVSLNIKKIVKAKI